jgi:transposase
LRGRARRGQRLVEKVPHGHWKTTTFVAALRNSGLTAPLVVDGPIDGRLFLAYVQQHLAPTLRPGDIVVLDNLSSHKVAGVRQEIEAVGAQVAYLPPYSPDFNPIEQVFAKLKSLVRSAKQRTVEGLWNLLGQLLDRFPPTECHNYIRHCGYATES